jgi:polyhydroxyalkanoate synthesis regulator phasin
VTAQHFQPFDEKYGYGKTKEELLKTGALIDEIPDVENKQGKESLLKYNKETNTVYYEYEDIPKSEEDISKEKINFLEKQVADLTT